MIRVKRIAHAAFLTPDLDRQIDYYTEVMGLTLVEREGDTAYLASTLDHHSVVLRKAARRSATGSPSRSRRKTTWATSPSRSRVTASRSSASRRRSRRSGT